MTKVLSRPYMNIQKGTVPSDSYKAGKAVGLLFTLDFLTHQAEGQCTSILNQTEKYIRSELNKLNVKLEVKTDEFEINNLNDLEVNLELSEQFNMNRGNPFKEGTD